jgi:CHASE2 domain-containing sensor protein
MFTWSCRENRIDSSIITIVDIGHLDRTGIAKELSLINRYSPKVIGLNFLLTTDSLEKDNSLSEELFRAKNIVVQASVLHDLNEDEVLQRASLFKHSSRNVDTWDSLEIYHSKFRFGEHGFVNYTTTDDSVLVLELSMREYYREDPEFAFCYVVANRYDNRAIDLKYKYEDGYFNFNRGNFRRHFKVITVNEMLSGSIDANDIDGKIVLMGYLGDFRYLDDERFEKISGTELQACFIHAIMTK